MWIFDEPPCEHAPVVFLVVECYESGSDVEEFGVVGSIGFKNMGFRFSTVVAQEDAIERTKHSKRCDEKMKLVHDWKQILLDG